MSFIVGMVSKDASNMAHERMAATLHKLTLSDWAFGLVVLTAGVLLPLVFVWRKLFGGAASGSGGVAGVNARAVS